MRPVVNTRKHIVQQSLAAVASGAITNIVLVNCQQDVDVAVASEVREGSKVTAIYVEMWISSDDAASGTAIVTLEKVPGAGGTSTMTAAESAALNDYDNKKNVFYTMMGLTPSNVQYPQAAIRGWIKIPKSKQRFGLEDRIILNVHGQSNGLALCGFAIYKEQY